MISKDKEKGMRLVSGRKGNKIGSKGNEIRKRETVGFYSSKGQSPLLSHTVMIAFSLTLLLMVVVTLNSIRTDYQEFIGRHEMREVCAMIKTGIEKIYYPETYNSSANTTKGKIILALPTRVGDMNYRIKFANESLFLDTTGKNKVNETCKIGFNITYSGSTNGGRTELTWVRYTNTSDEITMRRL